LIRFDMIREIVYRYLTPPEDFIYGYALLQGLLDKKFDGYNYGISIGRKLDPQIVNNIKDGPTIEYYNHYQKVNAELTELTGKINRELTRIGIDSMPIAPTIHPGPEGYDKEYLKTLSVDISHKMVATRAGLGWIGKTDLFVSRTFGPRLRLVSILIKQNPGVESTPVVRSECGKCNLCVVKSPAQAANGKEWNINIKRDEFFDPHKCREKCGELAMQRLKVDTRICGLCVSVCPYGK